MLHDDERTFQQVIESVVSPGEVAILGLTGQAGAGKTNHVTPLIVGIAQRCGVAVTSLGLDSFFKLSSQQRKLWLEEGERISSEEGCWRCDQINWWDFVKAEVALRQLKAGEPLHLTGVYNRRDGGELTGEVHIEPPRQGMLVVFDGVAICHLDELDQLMYVHAPARVRLERLRQRDKHRQGEEVFRRFELTQAFERGYFPHYWDRIDPYLFVDNSVDNPRMLHPLDCDTALASDGSVVSEREDRERY